MFSKIKILFIPVIISLSGLGGSAFGVTLSVPDNSPSIKAAMEKAQPGDIILVSCGTYYEHDVLVKSGVSLWSGTLQPSCVTLDAEGKGRGLIFANADSKTSVVGFTITGGLANPEDYLGKGGGILCMKSSPRISNCVITGNEAEMGGGLYADILSLVNLNNCQFENNQALLSGGGMAFVGEKATVAHCTIKNNVALTGAGLFFENGLDVQIANSQIVKNTAGNSGGGILLKNTDAVIDGTVFSANVGGLGGGGLAVFNSNPKLSRCTFYGNDSEKEGCALACIDSNVEILNSQLTYHPGPIMCSAGSTPLLTGCNLYGNNGGNWTGPFADQAFKRRNISENPMFCGAENGNFHLSSNSACLPDNNPAGNDNVIGAFGIGCSTVASNKTKPNRLARGKGM